jgi:hypothetical protein
MSQFAGSHEFAYVNIGEARTVVANNVVLHGIAGDPRVEERVNDEGRDGGRDGGRGRGRRRGRGRSGRGGVLRSVEKVLVSVVNVATNVASAATNITIAAVGVVETLSSFGAFTGGASVANSVSSAVAGQVIDGLNNVIGHNTNNNNNDDDDDDENDDDYVDDGNNHDSNDIDSMYDSDDSNDDSLWLDEMDEEEVDDEFNENDNDNEHIDDRRGGARDRFSFETLLIRRPEELLQSRGEILVGRNLRARNNPPPVINNPIDIIPPSSDNHNPVVGNEINPIPVPSPAIPVPPGNIEYN